MRASPAWFLLLIVPLLAAGVVDIQSNGAPMGSTNAPGELTCNRSGCHTGNPLNSGPATLTVDLGNTQVYQPGSVYTITVAVSEAGKERFGFQMLALHDLDTTNAGSFRVTDSVRTKVIAGINQFAGRSYMTYKYPGTAAVAPGLGQWSFEWQAPTGTHGPVTFYTAAAVADNDGTDQGEFIYTKILTLNALPTDADHQSTEAAAFRVFPNPSNGVLNLAYHTTGKESTSVYLCNPVNGHSILLLERKDQPGAQLATIDLRGSVAAGHYLVCIRRGTQHVCKSLILTP